MEKRREKRETKKTRKENREEERERRRIKREITASSITKRTQTPDKTQVADELLLTLLLLQCVEALFLREPHMIGHRPECRTTVTHKLVRTPPKFFINGCRIARDNQQDLEGRAVEE